MLIPLTRAAPQGPAVWCRKLFKGEECEEVWAWYAGQRASALARRSVNELWHRVGRTGRKRKLFADHEMRRRILAIKKGEYLALNKIKVARIVAGWAGSRGARRGAKARAVPAKPAPAPPCPLGSAPPAAAEVQEEVPVEPQVPPVQVPVQVSVQVPELPAPAELPATDMRLVAEKLDAAVAARQMSSNFAERARLVHLLLEECRAQGVLAYESGAEVCVLGWARVLVSDPQQLHAKVRDMVQQDEGGVWSSDAKFSQQTNPTWVVYEVLRSVGAKPRFRGPVVGDPGKHDMFYYKLWEFNDDKGFEYCRLSLAKRAAKSAAQSAAQRSEK